uniref:Uncharacterized protein n=1 Tax=Panagrellus redivivus TaxID=6233 RepID=A0A7E4VMK0_PANRE
MSAKFVILCLVVLIAMMAIVTQAQLPMYAEEGDYDYGSQNNKYYHVGDDGYGGYRFMKTEARNRATKMP